MIRVQILKKITNEVVEEKQIPTLFDLENFIYRVTSTDIRYNNYHIEKTQSVIEFFKRTYFSRFYVEFDDHIALCSLKHAQKRVKNYRKKTNSNRILENTLLRLQVQLNRVMRTQRAKATVIMPRLSSGRYEKIKIQVDEQVNSHTFIVEFDKILWDFKLSSIKTTKPNLIRLITQTIRYTTTPTKIYREKHRVIENENNVK